MRLDADEYQKALGEELRELRNRWGWTRKELGEQLDSEISLQTLATYELGTRHCSVVRLVELCRAMDEQPHELLRRVHHRIFPSSTGQLRVSLGALSTLEDAELTPLRRWAEEKLQHSDPRATGETDTVRLDTHALDSLAELCGVVVERLRGRLELLAG